VKFPDTSPSAIRVSGEYEKLVMPVTLFTVAVSFSAGNLLAVDATLTWPNLRCSVWHTTQNLVSTRLPPWNASLLWHSLQLSMETSSRWSASVASTTFPLAGYQSSRMFTGAPMGTAVTPELAALAVLVPVPRGAYLNREPVQSRIL
jgi:hypothetical protein